MKSFFESLLESERLDAYLKLEEHEKKISGLSNYVKGVISSEWKKAKTEEPKSLSNNSEPEHACDILICCPKTIEVAALIDLMGMDMDNPSSTWHTHDIFDFEIKRRNKLRNLKIKCISLNDQTNSITAAAVVRLIYQYKPSACILLGIAGTTKANQLGSAISSITVYNKDGGVHTEEKKLPRPNPMSVDKDLKKMLDSFEGRMERKSEKKLHQDSIKKMIEQCDYDVPKQYRLDESIDKIIFKITNVFSGDSVDRSGNLDSLSNSIDESAKSVEMEAHGFATACEQESVWWLTFRGYSDYADLEKGDAYQYLAASSASYCLKSFLENNFRLADEMIF